MHDYDRRAAEMTAEDEADLRRREDMAVRFDVLAELARASHRRSHLRGLNFWWDPHSMCQTVRFRSPSGYGGPSDSA